MKLRFTLYSLFLFAILSFGKLHAQTNFTVQFLSNDSSQYYFNDTIRTFLTLTMNGPGIYQGSLSFGYSVPTGNNQSDTVELQNQNPTLVIQGGQILTYEVKLPVSTAMFGSGGGHTVIVWPILTPLPVNSTVDSLYFDTEVLGWLSNPFSPVLNSLRLFPVPADEQLFLDNPDNLSMDLSIVDLSGKVWFIHSSSKGKITLPAEQLPSGMYVLRCVLPDGKYRALTWIKN